MTIDQFIDFAILEDTQDPNFVIPKGDHTSLSTISPNQEQKARALIKEDGVIAGIELSERIFNKIDPSVQFIKTDFRDGDKVNVGDEIFYVEGKTQSILLAERLSLNFMQRMSGIASLTRQYVDAVKGTGVTILDTRKTSPNLRQFEKWAVKIGGAQNHRFGLYDMIMIKDNHIDFAGGIENAIQSANDYLTKHRFTIPIEIETRNLTDVKRVLDYGKVQRIMLDNFSVEQVYEAVEYINKAVEVEVSGGINLTTVAKYAAAKPDFISVGALTHSYTSMDISLKALV